SSGESAEPGLRAPGLARKRSGRDKRFMRFAPLGDAAITVELGTDDGVCDQVRALTQALAEETPAGVVDVVPAYTTVTVFYDAAGGCDYGALCREIERRGTGAATARDDAR